MISKKEMNFSSRVVFKQSINQITKTLKDMISRSKAAKSPETIKVKTWCGAMRAGTL